MRWNSKNELCTTSESFSSCGPEKNPAVKSIPHQQDAAGSTELPWPRGCLVSTRSSRFDHLFHQTQRCLADRANADPFHDGLPILAMFSDDSGAESLSRPATVVLAGLCLFLGEQLLICKYNLLPLLTCSPIYELARSFPLHAPVPVHQELSLFDLVGLESELLFSHSSPWLVVGASFMGESSHRDPLILLDSLLDYLLVPGSIVGAFSSSSWTVAFMIKLFETPGNFWNDIFRNTQQTNNVKLTLSLRM